MSLASDSASGVVIIFSIGNCSTIDASSFGNTSGFVLSNSISSGIFSSFISTVTGLSSDSAKSSSILVITDSIFLYNDCVRLCVWVIHFSARLKLSNHSTLISQFD